MNCVQKTPLYKNRYKNSLHRKRSTIRPDQFTAKSASANTQESIFGCLCILLNTEYSLLVSFEWLG